MCRAILFSSGTSFSNGVCFGDGCHFRVSANRVVGFCQVSAADSGSRHFLVGRWQSSVIESGVLSFPPSAFFLPPSLARQIKMTDGLSPFGYPLPPPPKSYRTDNHQN